MEPRDMAPVVKRLTISETGSTCPYYIYIYIYI